MKTLPEGWKVTDAAHGVRIHQALVKQGENMLKGGTQPPWFTGHLCKDDISCNCRYVFGSDQRGGAVASVHVDNGKETLDEGYNGDPPLSEARSNQRFIAASRSLVPALVDGAKAFLKHYDSGIDGVQSRPPLDRWDEREKMAIALAQAWAPRMIEAGMDVPE